MSHSLNQSLASTTSPGWIRSPAFDSLLIGGTASIALLTGIFAAQDPYWFRTLLIVNMWALGYHHVIATYTRIGFDTQSLHEHRFLVFALPVLLLGVTTGLFAAGGTWLLATIYLHWQYFHYTRQSYGVEQIYWRRGNPADVPRDRATWAVIYAVPVWGLVHRSIQDSPTFLGLEVAYLPIPPWVGTIVAVGAVGTIAYWVALRVGEAIRGELRLAHTLYVTSHIMIFVSGYILIQSINPGWLLVNVWHNAQYLLIVWMFNTNRFRDGVDPKHRFLSTLSQPQNVVLYTLTCVCISTAFYLGSLELIDTLPLAAISATLIFTQTVNFHHYTVDAFVWKLRRPAVRDTTVAEPV